MHDHRKSAGNGARKVSLGFGGLSSVAGDHIGHFYRTRKEWKDVLTPFIQTGLEAGEQCIFHLKPDPAQKELRESLINADVDVDAALKSGQLIFSEGLTDPKAMQDYLHKVLADIPEKYPLLRWGGDMSWSFDKIPDTATLMEWESICNVIENPQAAFLCQYDLTQFMGSVVVDAMKTHPITIISNAIHENPFYEEPEAFLKDLRSRSKVS